MGANSACDRSRQLNSALIVEMHEDIMPDSGQSVTESYSCYCAEVRGAAHAEGS